MLPKQVFVAHLHAGSCSSATLFQESMCAWQEFFVILSPELTDFCFVHRLNVLKVRLYPPVLLGTFQESPLSEHSVKPVHEVCLHSGTISGWHKWRSPTEETTNADICCQLLGGKLHLQHLWESTWTLPQRGILKTPHILALFLNLRII